MVNSFTEPTCRQLTVRPNQNLFSVEIYFNCIQIAVKTQSGHQQNLTMIPYIAMYVFHSLLRGRRIGTLIIKKVGYIPNPLSTHVPTRSSHIFKNRSRDDRYPETRRVVA